MREAAPIRWSPGAVLGATCGLSALPFLLVELLPSRLYAVMGTSAYLVFHNVTEFFSVMVSLSVYDAPLATRLLSCTILQLCGAGRRLRCFARAF